MKNIQEYLKRGLWKDLLSGFIGYLFASIPEINLTNMEEFNFWKGIPIAVLIMLIHGVYSYKLFTLQKKIQRRLHILNYQSLMRHKSLYHKKPEEFTEYLEREKEELRAVAYKMFEGMSAKEVDRIIDTIYLDENSTLWLCKKL